MDFKTFCEKVGLPGPALSLIEEQIVSSVKLAEWKNKFRENEKSFLEELRMQKNAPQTALVLYLMLGYEAGEEYLKKGISEKIWLQSCRDIVIWAEDYYQKNGIWGLTELEWLGKTIRLELFRLGRLQFEPMLPEMRKKAEEKIRKYSSYEITSETEMIDVHIPAGEPLDTDKAIDSFRQAKQFFGARDMIFHCHSWLLSPALTKILPSSSRILQFQALFDVICVDHSFRQAEERVFGKVMDDYLKYAEKTSLQRSLKQYLIEKGDPGIGTGIISDVTCLNYPLKQQVNC